MKKNDNHGKGHCAHGGRLDRAGNYPKGPDGAFITGSDFLMDGGVTAAYWYGELAPKQI
jgi:hypothetical protein